MFRSDHDVIGNVQQLLQVHAEIRSRLIVEDAQILQRNDVMDERNDRPLTLSKRGMDPIEIQSNMRIEKEERVDVIWVSRLQLKHRILDVH